LTTARDEKLLKILCCFLFIGLKMSSSNGKSQLEGANTAVDGTSGPNHENCDIVQQGKKVEDAKPDEANFSEAASNIEDDIQADNGQHHEQQSKDPTHVLDEEKKYGCIDISQHSSSEHNSRRVMLGNRHCCTSRVY
jgi:hypothetical protein